MLQVHVTKMKLLPQLLNLKFSTVVLLLCRLILIISYMSTDINCVAAIRDNEANDCMALLAFKNEITQDHSEY